MPKGVDSLYNGDQLLVGHERAHARIGIGQDIARTRNLDACQQHNGGNDVLHRGVASIMHPTNKHGLSDRLLQAWFVPRMTTESPGRIRTSSTSVTR